MICQTCQDSILFDNGLSPYPMYGMAPHIHRLDETNGSFIGSTVNLPRSEWPKNFEPDEETYGQQGIWYCPNNDCEYSIEKHGEPK